MIHLFVEVLDKYFSNVCELDLVWHFNKVPEDNYTPTSRPCPACEMRWLPSSISTSATHGRR